MKKLFTIGFVVMLSLAVFLPASLQAQQPPTQPVIVGSSGSGPTFTLQNPLSSKFNSVGGIIQGFVEIFSYLVILLAVLAFIWTGLQYILARGNTQTMKDATKHLGWIVVGVAIVIGARIIITVVLNTLQAAGTVNPNVIQNASRAVQGQ